MLPSATSNENYKNISSAVRALKLHSRNHFHPNIRLELSKTIFTTSSSLNQRTIITRLDSRFLATKKLYLQPRSTFPARLIEAMTRAWEIFGELPAEVNHLSRDLINKHEGTCRKREDRGKEKTWSTTWLSTTQLRIPFRRLFCWSEHMVEAKTKRKHQ